MSTKTISKSTQFTITKKSADTTYVFKNDTIAESVMVNFNINANEIIYARQGDNLCIVTEFGPDQFNKKVILTTVKDYYKHCGAKNNLINVNEASIYNEATATSFRLVSGEISDGLGVFSLIGDKKKTEYSFLRLVEGNHEIYDLGGNDIYDMTSPNNNVSMTVIDYSGTDRYTLKNKTYNLRDYAGDDIYDVSSSAKLLSFDATGDDKYYVNGASSADIRDDRGKDYYDIKNITGDDGVSVIEYGGSDKYFMTSINKVEIEDSKSSDKYTFEEVGYTKIDDYEGDDKYNFSDVTTILITDDEGKDSYKFEQVGGEAKGTIEDESGKDKYALSNSKNLDILDNAGADVYDFKDSTKVSAYDVGGNDIYTVENSNEIYIVDGGLESGKLSWSDNYVISGAEVVEIDDADGNEDYRFLNVKKLELNDASGNDFYRLHAVVNPNYEEYGVVDSKGKDKYLVIESEKLKITDEKGNDTYKIQKSKNIDVVDREGNDKYTLENVTRTDLSSILDYKGNDKYTIKSSKAFISDKEGNDTYKITSAKITDGSVSIDDWNETSNDKYTIDKLTGRTAIDDMGGTKDNLTISSAKSKNLIYMANFQQNGKGVYDGSLIIIDKVNGGAVMIDDYFKTESSGGTTMITSEKDYGCIETIKAGKTNINSKINAFATTTDLAQLSSQVATWLSTNTPAIATVEDLFYDGTEAQINAFVAAFSQ